MNKDLKPERYELPDGDERTILRERIIKALNAVPIYFKSPINIKGLAVTDLFSMNTLLGGAIEDQTTQALNDTRNIWDPDGKYSEYFFKRYSESFPDVRLEKGVDQSPLIGIELKGWYLLSKEEMPSFRFRASADAVTEWDLLVVYPWSLSDVLSGTPKLEIPYIEQAKYAADYRTYYWEHRNPNAKKVVHPDTHPYPNPGSKYSDIAKDDSSGNFGRVARVHGLMDDWVSDTMKNKLAGIEPKWWVKFFKLFDEKGVNEQKIKSQFEKIADTEDHNKKWADEFYGLISQLMDLYK